MRKTLMVLVLALSVGSLSAAEIEEVFDRTLNVRAGTEFEIENVNGSITVTGWDQPRVRIHAVKKVESSDASAAREAMKQLRIEVRQTNDEISVDTIYPKRGENGNFLDMFFGSNVSAQVKYEINVPRNMDASVDTVNGSISLTDVAGEIELDTTNGKITVVRSSGSVDASTTNGGISVELVSVAPGKSMRFETTNGRITLAVPASLAAEINAATTNGSVRSDLPLTTTRFSRTSVKGTLNGGGPEIRLRTTNGGIDIKTVGAARATS
jgi:DUF4097 and DUF4098 domain-containing protein YvlB